MRDIIIWLNEALDNKDLVTGMTFYHAQNGMIKATNGRLIAAHPWPYTDGFMVPGKEFEKVLARLPDTPEIEIKEDRMRFKSAQFRGSIQVQPTEWSYPDINDADWLPIPKGLFDTLKMLRPFISDNATQPWALCVALENDWAYATNNIALAGAPCAGLGPVVALLPVWAVDFVLTRTERLTHWAWSENYVAFYWEHGAWMRSQLIVGRFPEKAAELVQESVKENPTQYITDEFREAFKHVADLAEDTVSIYSNRIESTFKKAIIKGIAQCEVPESSDHSIWGAKYLIPALQVAERWSPGVWPKPAPFKGNGVSGYVVGRKM